MAPLVGPRIQDLVKSLDPSYSLDAAAEQQILQLTDDFLDKVCKQALRMAQHRSSKTMDVQDLQLVLAKQWNIVIPGLGPPIPKKPLNVSRPPSNGVEGGGGASGIKRKASETSAGAGPARKMSKPNTGTAVPAQDGGSAGK
jgi:transcription initiation factor TFIID subunit TAF12